MAVYGVMRNCSSRVNLTQNTELLFFQSVNIPEDVGRISLVFSPTLDITIIINYAGGVDMEKSNDEGNGLFQSPKAVVKTLLAAAEGNGKMLVFGTGLGVCCSGES